MNFSEIMNAVQTLGVSVVFCFLMGWFVKYMFDEFMTDLKEERESHREESKTLQTAVDNNTQALVRLCERMGDNGGDSN